jgi:hypothetical protein
MRKTDTTTRLKKSNFLFLLAVPFFLASTASGDITPPDPVLDLTASSGPALGSVLLSWSAPGNDGISGLLNGEYLIHYATFSAAWDRLTLPPFVSSTTLPVTNDAPGSARSFILPNLNLPTPYHFVLWSRDEVPNWSAVSNSTASLPNLGDITPPDPVLDLTASSGPALGSVRLSWSAPGNDGISGLLNGEYLIHYATFSAAWDRLTLPPFVSSTTLPVTNDAPGSARSFILPNLNLPTPYHFVLWSRDEVPNWSAVSNSTASLPNLGDITAPAAVLDLTASSGPALGSVRLSWSAPGNDGISGLLNGEYLIHYATFSAAWDRLTLPPFVSSTTLPVTNDAPGSARSFILPNLNLPTPYHFVLWSRDEVPNWSAVSNSTASLPNLGDITPPDPVLDLTASSGPALGSVRLSWSAPGNDGISGLLNGEYLIHYATFSAAWDRLTLPPFVSSTTLPVTNDAPGSARSFILPNLNLPTPYHFVLWSRDEVPNWSAVSNSTASLPNLGDITPPDPVLDLTASSGPALGSVRLSWSAPGNDGISGLLNGEYLIHYATFSAAWDRLTLPPFVSSTTLPVTNDAPGSARSFILPNLNLPTPYHFVLWSRDEVPNWSAVSNSTASLPNLGDITPPDPVLDLTASSGPALGSVRLSWSAPGNDGISGLLNGEYLIHYATFSAAWDRLTLPPFVSSTTLPVTNDAPGSARSFILPNLNLPTPYHFVLWSRDEVPNWSAVSNSTSALPKSPVIVTRKPDHVRISDVQGGTYQIVRTSETSADIYVGLLDSDNVPVSTSVPISLSFSAFKDNVPFSDFGLSIDNFATLLPSTNNVSGALIYHSVIPAGFNRSPLLKFRTSTTGSISLEVRAGDVPTIGESRTAYYNFQVLGTTVGFTRLTLRTDSQSSATGEGVTRIDLSPDNDGIDDAAVIGVTPPTAGAPWEVLIATESSFTGILQRFASSGLQSVTWHGDGPDGRPVANGLYFIRVQSPGGGLTAPPLTVGVQTSFVQGTVRLTGPVPGAMINVYGAGGGGTARTNADGTYFVGGLRAGQNYTVETVLSGTLTARKIVAVSTATPNVDFQLVGAAAIRVHVSVPLSLPYTVYGRVLAQTAKDVIEAPLRLPAGSTGTDNGRPTYDPAYSTWTVINVSTGTLHTLELVLPEFGTIALSATSGDSGSMVDISTSIGRKANVYGWVRFPSDRNTPYGGQWVTVEATPLGAPQPTAWGGAWVINNQSSGVFRLTNLDPGAYALRAYSPGYNPQSVSTVTVATADLGTPFEGGVDFPMFTNTGTISGTITVMGDSSHLPPDTRPGFANYCPSGQVPLTLTAVSSTRLTSVAASVCLSTGPNNATANYSLTGLEDGVYRLNADLIGFGATPTLPTLVTVQNGIAERNITFQTFQGAIRLLAKLSAGDLPSLVSYTLDTGGAPTGSHTGTLQTLDTVTGFADLTNVGTGLYSVSLLNANPSSGLRKRVPVAVTNGSTTTLTVDMSGHTHSLTGAIVLEGTLNLGRPWNVTVTSAAGLGVAVSTVPHVEIHQFPLPSVYDPQRSPDRLIPTQLTGDTVTYAVDGLVPGSYLVRLAQRLDSSDDLADVASLSRVVHVGATGLTGIDLTISNGSALTGEIVRPDGDDSTDTRSFLVTLRATDNLSLWQNIVDTVGDGTAAYRFEHLTPGTYVLEIREDFTQWELDHPGTPPPPAKYSAATALVTVGSADRTHNISLDLAGTLYGKLRDADSGTLITAQNLSQYLSTSFAITARANPWIPGGLARASRETDGFTLAIDSMTHQFQITQLAPGTTYDLFFGEEENGTSQTRTAEQPVYAPTLLSGVRVSEGKIVDIGIVDLNRTVALSGTVKNSSGDPLPNIRVWAMPSLDNGAQRTQGRMETYTDDAGHYIFEGIDRAERRYDVTAAPRFNTGDWQADLQGAQYGSETKRMIDVRDPSKRVAIDFTLSLIETQVRGTVTTIDGGPLETPFEDFNNGQGQRRATLGLHRDGDPRGDNPLGEIVETTDANGVFLIRGLKPGTYTARVVALGYATGNRKFILSAGETTDLGTVVLNKGATLSGTITKSDGSPPSLQEAQTILAVADGFSDVVFGKVYGHNDTQLVTGYSLTGFQPNKLYSILIGTAKNDFIEVKTNVTVESTQETKGVNLAFNVSPPTIIAAQSQDEQDPLRYTLSFRVSQALQSLTADDNDLTRIVTLVDGTGHILSRELSASRDSLVVLYEKPDNESSFQFRLQFKTNVTDPESPTGAPFAVDKTFEFFAGVGLRRQGHVTNAAGGSVTLDGDPRRH